MASIQKPNTSSNIDQETGLLDEVTGRLAKVFNTCGFDMVCFDGCEDVDRRRLDYYAANFQALTMSKFQKRPLIHKGGGFHHNLWHSFTSSATVDQYPGTYLAYLRAGGTIDKWPTCKDHIDRTVGRVIACRDDMIPGELGWFGINPADGEYDGLQYDEVEYLLCKSLAYDAFGFVPHGEKVTLEGEQMIGNCGANDGKWHWTGRGGGLPVAPPGKPARLMLEKGEYRFRIYPREGSGKAETNPRLDVMCFCKESDDMPTDAQARAYFEP